MSDAERPSQQGLLRAHGIRPTKKRGQNFLIDGNLARAIAADILTLGREVVELGAGGGALTKPLLDGGAKVLAVEVDRHLCRLLRGEFGSRGDFSLREEDLARIDWDSLIADAGSRPVLAGNLPYGLTSEVLFALADHKERLAGGVFMVQREVAGRLIAEPGTKDYGILAVLLGSLFSVDLVRTVPANVFWPRPDVVSAVVRLVPSLECWPEAEFRDFKETIKALFQQRRKQIAKILKSHLGLEADAAAHLLAAAGIDPGVRPEQVPRTDLRQLSRLLHRGGPA